MAEWVVGSRDTCRCFLLQRLPRLERTAGVLGISNLRRDMM